jgi:hypothetical protein
MCCWRKEDRVDSESEMRRREERSLSSWKWDVHWAMSWMRMLATVWSYEGRDESVQKRDPRREA